MKQLTQYLDQMRLGLIYTIDENNKREKKADFVIEDMNKSTAEVFTNNIRRHDFFGSYKLRSELLPAYVALRRLCGRDALLLKLFLDRFPDITAYTLGHISSRNGKFEPQGQF
jgi:hypothetical protein